MAKTRILMVCLGNICRSPVAEGIMLKLILEKDLNLFVDSAGTAGYHVGEAPDSRTINNAKKNGVDLTRLKARKFVLDDFDAFDKIYVMDEQNFQTIVSLTQNKEHHKKVNFLLNELYPAKDLPVPDPYYGDESDFEKVFYLIRMACEKIGENLK